MLSVIIRVLRLPKYFILTLFVAVVTFSLAIWLPNLSLIIKIIFDTAVSLSDKVGFLVSLYGAIETNFSLLSASTVILISILFGIQVALLVYYFKKVKSRVGLKKISTTGILGLVSGFFGIGCAACGAILLTSVLSLVGAGGLLAVLPLGGAEFGFVGIGLLVFSIYLLSKKINEPLVCV